MASNFEKCEKQLIRKRSDDSADEEFDEVFINSPSHDAAPYQNDSFNLDPDENGIELAAFSRRQQRIPSTTNTMTVIDRLSIPDILSTDFDRGYSPPNLRNDNIYNGFINPSFDLYNAKSLNQPSSPLLLNEGSAADRLTEPDADTDCFIPHGEKMVLLRKFSAPISQDPTTTADKFSIKKQYQTTPIMSDFYDMRTKLNDKYKCNVCHNPFNDPRVLDCLHIFCLECLLGIERNSIQGRGGASASANECTETDLSGVSESSLLHSVSMASLADAAGTVKKSRSRSPLSNFTAGVHFRSLFKSTASNASALRRKSSVKYAQSSNDGLREKSGASIKCPRCEYVTTISIGGLNRLPRHLLLQRKVHIELNKLEKETSSNVQCSQCNEENPAISHCYTCSVILCLACEEQHLADDCTKMHNLLKLPAIIVKQDDDLRSSKRIVKCYIHPSHELKLYCTSCNQMACQNCTILLHKGHKLDPILRATKTYLKLFNDALERNRQLNDYANDSIIKMNGFIKKFDRKAEATQSEVEFFLRQYFEALEAHKRTLLKQIAKAKETRVQEMLEQQKKLGTHAFDVRNATQFAEDLVSEGNDIEILALVGIMLRRFEHCYKSNAPFEAKFADSLRFLPDVRAPETQKQNNIPMYGIIATRTAVAKFCSLNVEEPIILRVFRKTELTVISRDIDERPLCHGGLTLMVDVKYIDASFRSLPTKVSDERDGTYIIRFTPDAAGKLIMSVKVQDKDIQESPFNMIARTLRPHSGIYQCCTFCTTNGSKTATCACEGKMTGGYKGCGHGHDGHPGRRHWSCCASTLESSECSATNSFR